MAKELSIFLSISGKTEWSESFMNAFCITAKTFFKASPTIISIKDNPDKNAIGSANVWVIVAPKQGSETESWKDEILLMLSILQEKPNIPVFIVQENRNIANELAEITNKASNYNFFDIDPETRQPRCYKPYGTSAESGLFWSHLLDLFYELSEAFHASSSITKSLHSVFIAPVSGELSAVRNRLVWELRQRKVEIFPKQYCNHNDNGIINDDMFKQVSLCIHLLGYQYGDIYPGSNKSYSEYYCQQTSLFCHNNNDWLKNNDINTFRFICLPLNLEKADQQQSHFVHSLRYDDANSFTDVVQLPVEDLKLLIIDHLNKKNKKAKAEVNDNSTYLIFDPQSPGQVQKISTVLREKGFEILSLNYLDPKVSLTDQHRQNLAKAGSVIIIDNNAPDQWILSKIKDIMKAPGIGRIHPFNTKALITGQEEKLTQIAKQNGFKLLPIDDSLANAISEWKNQ